jgi:hypothetical protein
VFCLTSGSGPSLGSCAGEIQGPTWFSGTQELRGSNIVRKRHVLPWQIYYPAYLPGNTGIIASVLLVPLPSESVAIRICHSHRVRSVRSYKVKQQGRGSGSYEPQSATNALAFLNCRERFRQETVSYRPETEKPPWIGCYDN